MTEDTKSTEKMDNAVHAMVTAIEDGLLKSDKSGSLSGFVNLAIHAGLFAMVLFSPQAATFFVAVFMLPVSLVVELYVRVLVREHMKFSRGHRMRWSTILVGPFTWHLLLFALLLRVAWTP